MSPPQSKTQDHHERLAVAEVELEHLDSDVREVKTDVERIEASLSRIEAAMTVMSADIRRISERPPSASSAAQVVDRLVSGYRQIGVIIVCVGASVAVATGYSENLLKLISQLFS